MRTFWQPPAGQPADYALAGLQSLLGFVTNVHVQLSAPVAAGGTDGQPLSAGEERWRPYIKALRATGRWHMLLLGRARRCGGAVPAGCRDAQGVVGVGRASGVGVKRRLAGG